MFRVTGDTVPTADLNAPQMQQLKDNLVQRLRDEQVGEYIAWLEKDIGTKVNQEAVAQATGAAAN